VTGRKLKFTAISSGNLGATVPAGFAPVDAATNLRCPGTRTCTFEADQNLQVFSSTSTAWAICTSVDGNFMAEPSCPYLGLAGGTGFFQTGTFAQSMSGITPGTHSVQTFVYSDNGLDVYNYAFVYHIYTP
jgi:hypothetical protein